VSDDLDLRQGLPEALRFLVAEYPREAWPDHPNLGGLSRFWLGIHEAFREQSRELQAETLRFREGKIAAEEFRLWLPPRLRLLLMHLNGHHQIEDHQFFPIFGAAEPRLLKGFDLLEEDHHAIHATLDRIVASANAFLRTSLADGDALRAAADAYAADGDALIRQLDRHLADEEDLVIPLILDRSEGALGM